jgi:hypothetical protein
LEVAVGTWPETRKRVRGGPQRGTSVVEGLCLCGAPFRRCRWRIANLGHFLDFAILLLCSVMCDLAVLFIHLITTIVRLAGPGGARSVVAESVLVKQQLLILNRSRHRSPNLRVCDRVVAGSCALVMRPRPPDPLCNRIETVNSLEPSSSAEESRSNCGRSWAPKDLARKS